MREFYTNEQHQTFSNGANGLSLFLLVIGAARGLSGDYAGAFSEAMYLISTQCVKFSFKPDMSSSTRITLFSAAAIFSMSGLLSDTKSFVPSFSFIR